MVNLNRLLAASAAGLFLLLIAGGAAYGGPSDLDFLDEDRFATRELRMIPLEPGCEDWVAAATDLDDPLPDGALLPPTYEACNQGLRPGARMTSPSGCTFNFVFQQGSTFYIGTAGHCVSSVNQRVSGANVGEFGTVVYLNTQGNMDFALIRIDAEKNSEVNPRLCTWGGPQGITSTSGLTSTDPLLQYGWGIASQFTAQTRSRAHQEFLSSSAVLSWNGVGSGGDSGSPMIDGNGLAIGIHTWGVTPVAGVVLEAGPSMTAIMSTLQNAGWNVQLVDGGPGGL